MSTTLLTEDERALAFALVPWRADVRKLAGQVFGSLKNQAVDMIDAALGPNHARAALVALYEGVDLLLEATIDLAESVACELYFARSVPVDPLGEEPLTNPEELARIPWRFARYCVEDAGTRVVTAGDHLANAHVRLAWEANAATLEEVEQCGFDPSVAEPRSWITVPDLDGGLKRSSARPLASVFADFGPTSAFTSYSGSDSVSRVRQYRHAVIHRARPTYRELPALGRTTLWTQNAFSIMFPPPEPGEDQPTVNDHRELVAEALKCTLSYALAVWDHAVRWLRSVDVWLTFSQSHVTVQTEHRVPIRVPREGRDPGPFLVKQL